MKHVTNLLYVRRIQGDSNSIALQYFGISTFQNITILIAKFQKITILIVEFPSITKSIAKSILKS